MTRLLTWIVLEGALAWFLRHSTGLDTTHALMVWATLAATTTITHHTPRGTTARWPRDTHDKRPGARDDVSALSWTLFGKDDTASASAIRTLRTITTTRLHTHGIDLDDPTHAPQARALLGPDLHDLLHTPHARPPITTLEHHTTTLENLPPPPTPTHRRTRTHR
ncbi:hypothetical protein [Sanguibacter suaedae]|uniref:Uncharacterized protein n=1 Tax=Sanguibacter suaedae TaxID=2795737 RepID=A0A934I5U9_9MICO|nr:hypothetical protein [Sanguibacter suaedae]MBI9116164.1 hypothetical protein [Sanguibacter suaedae]